MVSNFSKNFLTMTSNSDLSGSVKNVNDTRQTRYFINPLIINLLMIVTVLLSQNAYALSSVTASIDKNPAMVNESILLTITADDDVSRNDLDTRPLLKDFIVGNTSVSSQTSMVNFKTTRKTTWQVILIARSAGQFIIPALSVENQQSAPIELTVLASKTTADNSQANIFLTSELSSQEVYVQQSLTLSVKLHFAVDLQSASITEPDLTGATFEKQGKDQQSDAIINGKRYRVIEQKYALTPEQSGNFTLKAPIFSGEIRQASNRRSSFLSYGQSKPVSVIGDELNLAVLPIPANYPQNAQWLPTDILTLHQEWQGNNGEYTVGEPITRTVRLTASGLSKAQLPKLEMQETKGMKIYPDQADLHSTLRNDKIISQKVQNFAIVPSVEGDFILPPMSVTWFNTVTNKIEQATLPAQPISVKASTETLSTNSNNQYKQTNSNDENSIAVINNNEQGQHVTGSNAAEHALTTVQDKRLQWLFLSLWLLTTLAWIAHIIYLKRHNKSSTESKINRASNNGNHYLPLLAACKKSDAEQALNLILPWLKQLINNDNPATEVHNIAQAQTFVNDETLASSLNDLQQHLYGKGANKASTSWDGKPLLNAIQSINNQHREKKPPHLSLNP